MTNLNSLLNDYRRCIKNIVSNYINIYLYISVTLYNIISLYSTYFICRHNGFNPKLFFSIFLNILNETQQKSWFYIVVCILWQYIVENFCSTIFWGHLNTYIWTCFFNNFLLSNAKERKKRNNFTLCIDINFSYNLKTEQYFQ